MRTRMRNRGWRIGLAAVTVAALAACGSGNGETGSGSADFNARLQAILQDARANYVELAERASKVDPNKPLPDDFKARMRSQAASDRRAADAIQSLAAPQPAQESLRTLVTSLRARADAFEKAASQAVVTMQQLEEEGTLTAAGDRIDGALRALRDAGYLPKEEAHD